MTLKLTPHQLDAAETWGEIILLPRQIDAVHAHAAVIKGALGGRPKKLKPCPRCSTLLGSTEMRAHKCGGAQ